MPGQYLRGLQRSLALHEINPVRLITKGCATTGAGLCRGLRKVMQGPLSGRWRVVRRYFWEWGVQEVAQLRL